ncbi:MAG: glycoside hydrolase family 3 [Candidatus Rokuibacteriota bacterium]|nr:MAG: glycoside hydrolase family 3 [Candidatus Rokubacteria bacterium]
MSSARAWRGSLRRLAAASLLSVLLTAGCGSTLAPDGARLTALERELGSLVLVGFHGTDADGNPELSRLLCDLRVGGVLLLGRNIVDADQLSRLTGALTAQASTCTGRKLLVAVDAEGGNVMRLAPRFGWPATFSAQELGESNDFVLTELEARRIGAMLRAVGINWDLAPVVDVGYNPANPVIVGAARSFGANPQQVTEHARAFVQGLRAEGALTALKHFPGHGSSFGDTHRGFTDVTDTAVPELELAPYRALIADGLADSVMIAHVFNRRLDDRYPATLSRPTIDGLLRGVLGFKGVVVSDDLRMGAIEKQYGIGEAAVLALDAGVDVLLIVEDRLPDGSSATQLALAAMREALAKGTLDPARVEAAIDRVRAFRARVR